MARPEITMITRSPGGHPKNRLQITPVNPAVCPCKNQEKTMKKNHQLRCLPHSIRQYPRNCSMAPNALSHPPEPMFTLGIELVFGRTRTGNLANDTENMNGDIITNNNGKHYNSKMKKTERVLLIFPTHRCIGGETLSYIYIYTYVSTTMGSIYIYIYICIYIWYYIYVRL